MTYNFTDEQLANIRKAHDQGGPRIAFLWWHGLVAGTKIETEDVEDFAIAFMEQYNQRFGLTY